MRTYVLLLALVFVWFGGFLTARILYAPQGSHRAVDCPSAQDVGEAASQVASLLNRERTDALRELQTCRVQVDEYRRLCEATEKEE